MNWEAVGAIGDALAAIGVIVTLVYLAAQIRQNTASLRASTWQAVNQGFTSFFSVIGASPGAADVLLRGLSEPAKLSPEQRLQFSFILLHIFHNLENLFIQNSLGTVAPELAARVEHIAAFYAHSPGFRDWWDRNRPGFGANFRAFVDEEVRGSAAATPAA